MNDAVIVPIFVVIDAVMGLFDHRSHPQAGASDREVLTVAVAAAGQCQNHQERALAVRRGQGYRSGALSVSRFTRRRHAPPTGCHCSWLCWGSLRDGRSGRAGPHAGAGLAPGAGRAVPHRAGREECGDGAAKKETGGPLGSIRLAAPPRDHSGGHPGLLRPPARVAA